MGSSPSVQQSSVGALYAFNVSLAIPTPCAVKGQASVSSTPLVLPGLLPLLATSLSLQHLRLIFIPLVVGLSLVPSPLDPPPSHTSPAHLSQIREIRELLEHTLVVDPLLIDS